MPPTLVRFGAATPDPDVMVTETASAAAATGPSALAASVSVPLQRKQAEREGTHVGERGRRLDDRGGDP